MKKIITLIALSCVTLLSADQYYGYGCGPSGCPSCPAGPRYIQTGPRPGPYQQPQYDRQMPQYEGQMQMRGQEMPMRAPGEGMMDMQDASGSFESQRQMPSMPAGDLATTEEDKKLNDKIREKLSGDDLVQISKFVVLRTSNGVVVLGGVIEKPEDIKKLEEQVKSVEGVKSVTTQVTEKK